LQLGGDRMEILNLSPKDWLGGFLFLESPRWHKGELWVSDIRGHAVYAIDEAGNKKVAAEVEGLPSGIGFLPDGMPLVASMKERQILRISDGVPEVYADLGDLVQSEVNDMVVDAKGRAFVGGYDFDLFAGQKPLPAKIISVANDGSSQIAAEGLAFPNGMVLMEDTNHLVVAETLAHRLTKFDVNTDGTLTNRQLFAQFDELHPDGICLDQEGGIWVSSFSQGRFLRVLDGGEITHQIDVPGRHAIACQLGGRDGKTLFCLTTEGSMAEIASYKSKSFIMTVEVEVAGAGSP